MKTVSLIQVNFQQGPEELNSYYLPYSLGVLWCYAQTSSFVQENYKLDQIIFKRQKDLKTLAKRLSSNSIVAFSTYVWNKNYHYTLAKEIKKLNKDCTIIFGGPELPITKKDIFMLLPFIDIVVKKEGELTFKDILENLDDLESVEGILINRNRCIDTGDRKRIENLEILVSPYIENFFDDIIRENPDIDWSATLETNRGCPYQCTFCDWGSLTYSKIKCFSLEKVFKELDWMAKNRCGFVFVADANFGIFPERDDKIIEHLIEVQDKYGYPKTVTLTWAKNQKSEVVKIAKKLIDSKSMNNGLTISVQTLDEKVLTIIKRKNLNQHKIEEIFSLCEKANIPLNTELILGLPGETLESWKKSIFKLFESGNHSGVDITQVELLENAEMNLVQKEIYNMKSIEVFDYLGHSDDGIEESISVVVSTDTMPFEDMIEAQWFNTFINTFHIGGLTSMIARFLNRYKNIPYQDFYRDLETYLEDWTWLQSKKLEIKQDFNDWMINGRLSTKSLAGIELNGYNLIYKLLFFIHFEKQHDELFQRLFIFLDRYEINFLKDELLEFQKSYTVIHTCVNIYPLVKEFNFNFYDVIFNQEQFCQRPSKLEFVHNIENNISFQKFLELLYYARRRNFGKCIIQQS